jgi:hypothetical protein
MGLPSPQLPASQSSNKSFADDIKHEVLANYLYQKQRSHVWLSGESGASEGVLVRKSRSLYVTCPPQLAETRLAAVLGTLDCQVAMTVNSKVIKVFLAMCSTDALDVPLANGLRIQLLPTMEDLLKARKLHFAAFLASEGLLVVWDDEASNLVMRARKIEAELMGLVWGVCDTGEKEKSAQVLTAEVDEESGKALSEVRPTHLFNAFLVMITILLIFLMLGAAARQITIEISVDHHWIRLCLLALIPVQVFFTLVSRSLYLHNVLADRILSSSPR